MGTGLVFTVILTVVFLLLAESTPPLLLPSLSVWWFWWPSLSFGVFSNCFGDLGKWGRARLPLGPQASVRVLLSQEAQSRLTSYQFCFPLTTAWPRPNTEHAQGALPGVWGWAVGLLPQGAPRLCQPRCENLALASPAQVLV